jgi:DNA-binding MarR family transcriptional regulator
MRALSYYQRQTLNLLRQQQKISYEDLATRLGSHRGTAVLAIRRLIHQQLIVKIPGSGPYPNRYIVN